MRETMNGKLHFFLKLNLIVLGILCSNLYAEEAKKSPKYIIENSMNEIIDLLSKNTNINESKIKENVSQIFDYRELGRLSLIKFWNIITGAQKEKFLSIFQKVIEDSYIKKAKNIYLKHKLKFTTEKINKTKAIVYSTVKQKEVDIEIEYHMRKGSDTWKIYDIKLDQSSLVKTYKDQFNKYLNKHSFDEFLAQLDKKRKEK
jgi:phospholipid transport system substrate-binding protein